MPQASSVAIPQALQSPEFREVWALWESYRKEIGKGLKDTTRRLQLDKLARYPQDIAIAALRQSMENGWVGFFPDKLVAQPAGHKQAPRASQRPTYEAKREGKVL